jgi:hypothetical protein
MIIRSLNPLKHQRRTFRKAETKKTPRMNDIQT